MGIRLKEFHLNKRSKPANDAQGWKELNEAQKKVFLDGIFNQYVKDKISSVLNPTLSSFMFTLKEAICSESRPADEIANLLATYMAAIELQLDAKKKIYLNSEKVKEEEQLISGLLNSETLRSLIDQEKKRLSAHPELMPDLSSGEHAAEKTSSGVIAEVKQYAKEHPYKAALMGIGIGVGVAAFVTGCVMTGGILAGATAGGIGLAALVGSSLGSASLYVVGGAAVTAISSGALVQASHEAKMKNTNRQLLGLGSLGLGTTTKVVDDTLYGNKASEVLQNQINNLKNTSSRPPVKTAATVVSPVIKSEKAEKVEMKDFRRSFPRD